MTEKDWERLRMAGKRANETARPRDNETTRLRDGKTTRLQDCETTRRREDETTRRRGYTSAKNAGIARNIPKSRSLVIPEKHSHSQAFSAILSLSQSFPAVRGSVASEGRRVLHSAKMPSMGSTKAYVPLTAFFVRGRNRPLITPSNKRLK